MKKISTVIISIAICSTAFAQSIYVSPTGNDSASGDQSHPLATIAAAKAKASAGATIYLSEGTFSDYAGLAFTEKDSGIKIVGAGMGKTIISGGLELPPFTAGADGVWRIDLKAAFPAGIQIPQLFVDGKRAPLARTPNEGECFVPKDVIEAPIDDVPEGGIRKGLSWDKLIMGPDATAALKDVSYNPSQMRVTFLHKWDNTKRAVWSLSDNKDTVFFVGNATPSYLALNEDSQFFFEGDHAFLDAPGEWFYDNDSRILSYIPREGEDITSARATVPATKQLLEIRGTADSHVKDMTFEGISFEYTFYQMPSRGQDPQQAAAPTDATISVDFADGILFRNCEIAHTGNNGIWIREACRDCEVSHCWIHDLGIGGAKIGTIAMPADEERDLTRNIKFDNNILAGGSKELTTGTGIILFKASDCSITHNEIQDFGYSGVSVGWVWGYSHSPSKRNSICFNHIHHIGWGLLSDMGGVYTLGLSEGTVVSNNVIHDIYSFGYGGWGLYTDEGSSGITMENNLVYNCKCAGFTQHYGENNIIRNNLFAGQIHDQLSAGKVEDHVSFTFSNNIVYYKTGDMYSPNWHEVNFISDNNLYWHEGGDVSFNGKSIQEWRDTTGKDMHSIIADPGLKPDFTLSGKKALKKIGFKVFDWKEAGVYGDEQWRQKAIIDPAREQLYKEIVDRRERAAAEANQ